MLLALEEEAVAEFLEASASGADPGTMEHLLRIAREIAQLREHFMASARDETLAADAPA